MGKQSRPKIHVSIRPTRITPASATILRNNKIINRSIKSTKTIISSKTFDQYDSSYIQDDNSFLANSTDYAKNIFISPIRKKKLQLKKYIIVSSILLIIIIATLSITLPVLLIKSKSKSQQIENKTLQWKPEGITITGVAGLYGNASNKLYFPLDLYIDWSYTLYVADEYNHRIQKFLRDQSTGVTVAGQVTGIANSTANTLRYPSDVFADTNGNMYITDRGNNRIQFWAKGATSGTTIAGTGVIGSSNTTLNQPYAATFESSSNKLYVADRENQRIMSYTFNNTVGTIVAGGNGFGTGANQLCFPQDIYFDSVSNSFIISNFLCHNIVRWRLGSLTWELIAGYTNGSSSSSSTGFWSPVGVTLDPMGNIYVADMENNRIQFFSSGQRNGQTIAGMTGMFGINSTLLYYPASIALDNQLNLYVSDRYNYRIQKFLRY